MIPFDKCPICKGEMVEKEVEKLLRGGNNTAVIKVKAEVCLHCGERFYSKNTISKFEEIRMKLEKNEVSNFELLGETYKVKNEG
jgi:YgiT-type zinc finger domain-containing protein